MVDSSSGRSAALGGREPNTTASRNAPQRFGWPLAVFLILALLLWRLGALPPLFWDEGWTLMIARTWVERGQYARMLGGETVFARLGAAFPVTVPVALSFRLLGTGIWQGRVVVALYTVGALGLLCFLAGRLYNKRVALGALASALLMGVSPNAHVLILGRMVMAEMPMMFFLLGGYASLLLTLRRSIWFLVPMVLSWALALLTKAQALPFWIVSLVIPLAVCALLRRQRETIVLLTGIVASRTVSHLLLALWLRLPLDRPPAGPPLTDLAQASAIVPVGRVRMAAVKLVLIAAWPTLLAVTHAAAGWLRGGARHRADDPDAVVRLALLALTGSWLGWYVVLSVGWSRYLLPPVFLSGVFVSAFLWELTSGYDLSGTIKRAAQALCKPSLKREGLRALLAVSLVVWSVALTAYYLPGSLSGTQDVGVSEAAAFLNARVAPDELIECYSSELLFLLDRPYHYPPDLVNVQMILWYSWREDVSIDYDPLSADPDYLVMCRQPAGWGTAPLLTTAELYDEVLLTGEFRLLRTFGPYEVYQRAR